jgi:phage gpG-like protein
MPSTIDVPIPIPDSVLAKARRMRRNIAVPSLRIRVNLDAMTSLYKDMVANGENLDEFWRLVGDTFRESFKKNFQEGGRPRWQGAAPSTSFRKQLKRQTRLAQMGDAAFTRRIDRMVKIALARRSKGLLVDTGAYRSSFIEKGDTYHVEKVDKNSITIGSSHPLTLHEAGTKPYVIRPRRAKSLRWVGMYGQIFFAKEVHHPGVPARPVAIIQQEDVETVIEGFKAHILKRGTG